MTKITESGIVKLWEAIWNVQPAPAIEYKEPGSGAVEFAREYTASSPRREAMAIVIRLMDGELHDGSDKRVKRCAHCGYFYRDKTRPNNSVVCSVECRDERRKSNKRQAHVPKPKKPTRRERYYFAHLEYPFWGVEHEMFKDSMRYEVPKSTEKIEHHRAARDRREAMGGKAKKPEVIAYNGDEKGVANINVKFLNYGQREPGEVVCSRMTREEVNAHLLATYGAEKLAAERRRAEIFRQEMRY